MSNDPPECCRRSFAASIKDTARRLLDDPSIAPRDVSRQRLEICEGCERFQEKSRICDLCGCYMPLKTTMSNMRCPIDLWTEYKRAD
jgi:hypothetical protein